MSGPGARFGGGAGGAFAQSFAQTLIQGSQLIEQNRQRGEELDLQKKLAAANLQKHEAEMGILQRQAQGYTDLQSRLVGQSWPDSELGAGGATTPAPIGRDEGIRLMAKIDPKAALTASLDPKQDFRDIFKQFMAAGDVPGTTPASAPKAGPQQLAGPETTPAATAPSATAPATTVPTELGPQRKLDRSIEMSSDGVVKLKIGDRNVQYQNSHFTGVGPDGTPWIFRMKSDPENGTTEVNPMVKAPPPAEMVVYGEAVKSLGLKEGTEPYKAAVADLIYIDKTMTGKTRENALAELEAQYRAIAANPISSASPPAATGAAAPPKGRNIAASATAAANKQEVDQAAAKAGAEETSRFNAKQKESIGDDAIRFINKKTLQHPQASMTRGDVQSSKDYVQVNPTQAQSIQKYQATKSMLDTLERIVISRPDLFPPSSGNAALDVGRVTHAEAKAWAKRKTDIDIGQLDTLKVNLPNVIKAFGDTANVAVAERAITESAVGLTPSTKEQALGRIDLLRQMVNESSAPIGLPPIQRAPGPKPKAVVPEKGEPVFNWDPDKRRLVPAQP